MSLCGKDRSVKKRRQGDIELNAILKFIRFIQAVACGMLGISILGFVLVANDIQARVIYTMVIIVNIVIIFGGIIPIRILEKKDKPDKT